MNGDQAEAKLPVLSEALCEWQVTDDFLFT